MNTCLSTYSLLTISQMLRAYCVYMPTPRVQRFADVSAPQVTNADKWYEVRICEGPMHLPSFLPLPSTVRFLSAFSYRHTSPSMT
ncbi:hypothetical protein K402DRAFT_389083 [Aulographum hederae CBS 113979]|uniref:Uncharacterized protein n=1 Tax=Aulographum hederae CBS 113979 TaxID=1176131 RepID=A0A6G1HF44_9PEZI|nr:hypothetical protein K402DRAFT_389083 [Aulographum hederae CBS 113979]